MDWSKLITDFLNGKTEAIQAIFTIAGFVVGIVGTVFVAITFKQQARINRQQYNLNRIAGEKHRRAVRPNFQAKFVALSPENTGYELKLVNALALNIKLFDVDANGTPQSNSTRAHNAWELNDEPVFYPLSIDENITGTVVLRVLCFMDEDETEYTQQVIRKGTNIYTTFPKLKNGPAK